MLVNHLLHPSLRQENHDIWRSSFVLSKWWAGELLGLPIIVTCRVKQSWLPAVFRRKNPPSNSTVLGCFFVFQGLFVSKCFNISHINAAMFHNPQRSLLASSFVAICTITLLIHTSCGCITSCRLLHQLNLNMISCSTVKS